MLAKISMESIAAAAAGFLKDEDVFGQNLYSFRTTKHKSLFENGKFSFKDFG